MGTVSHSMWSELGMTSEEAALTVLTATGIYAAIILFSRIFGQRQFAMSSTYDLAFTFALGSLVGRVILVRTSLLTAVVGLATMFVLHGVTGWLHHNVTAVHRAIQNNPILLVAHGQVLDHNLRRARTSRVEVYQQVRLKGVGTLGQVQAAILERNGQMSVIRVGTELDESVFTEVHDHERLLGSGTAG